MRARHVCFRVALCFIEYRCLWDSVCRSVLCGVTGREGKGGADIISMDLGVAAASHFLLVGWDASLSPSTLQPRRRAHPQQWTPYLCWPPRLIHSSSASRRSCSLQVRLLYSDQRESSLLVINKYYSWHTNSFEMSEFEEVSHILKPVPYIEDGGTRPWHTSSPFVLVGPSLCESSGNT